MTATDCHYTVRDIWDRIVQRAWESGDPGLVFIDEVNRHNQTPQLGPIRATNPCGEQPLLPYEACNLGSINLAAFCDPGPQRRPIERIDWDGLGRTVELAVRFLDNVVEVNQYPTPEIDEATRATRKIGLGVMGFADLLFKLGSRLRLRRGTQAGRPDRLLHPRSRLGRERAAGRGTGQFPGLEGQHLGHSSTAAGRCGTPTW